MTDSREDDTADGSTGNLVERDAEQPEKKQQSYPRRGRGYGGSRPVCWTCQEEGHMRADCPLNYNRPVGPVANWPRNKN